MSTASHFWHLSVRLSDIVTPQCSQEWSSTHVTKNYSSRPSSSSMVTLARPPTRSSLKITNRSFQYAAPYLWNQLPTELASPVRYCLLHVHLLSHIAVHLHYHHFHHLSLVHSFILNWRLGSLTNPFHHRPFPHLPDWFYGLSAHLTFLFCSTAGFVCTVC